MKLLTAGDVRARKALAEVAAERWVAAVELLEALALGREAEPEARPSRA